MNQVTAIDMPVHRFSSQSVKCFTIKAVKRSVYSKLQTFGAEFV